MIQTREREPEQVRELQADFESEPGMLMLADVEAFFGRYAVLPPSAPLVVALWAVATHLADCFDAFPYLSLSSPLSGCGKSRVLELLHMLSARPWFGAAPTEAVLFRFIHAKKPTILLDEVESLNSKKRSERDAAILAILHAGYRKGQTAPRCTGSSHELQMFEVYGPKAFASIGHLPAALRDRCIVIPMQKHRPDERLTKFWFERTKQQAAPPVASIEKLTKAFRAEIKHTYVNLPELACLVDREEELFAPLFAACAVLANSRLSELERAALALPKAKAGNVVDDSLPLRLLSDIRSVWPDSAEKVLSAELITELSALQESSWHKEIELTQRRLAYYLRDFDVRPGTVRLPDGRRGKGYVREKLSQVFACYLPLSPPISGSDP